MAKAKKRKSKAVRRKKTAREKWIIKAHRLSPSLVLMGLLIVIFLGLFVWVGGQKANNLYKLSQSIPLANVASQSAQTATPSATVTPTPSPVPLTGYCLHVPILTYHHIQPESSAQELGQVSLTVDSGVFDQQMAYLVTNGYTPIWANELIDALRNHTGLSGKPVLITMDDGYADNYNYALPVLRKYGIKANLMLSSGLVGSNPDMLTWDQVNQMRSSGLVYLTNHSWSHYSIANGPQSKIESEIDTAQNQIQQYTGQTVNVFTYPYGSLNGNAIQALQRKGYIGAFSTIPGAYQCDSFIMALHRNRIGNGSLASYGL